jgi:deoxyribodipyrimidine photo-lyase
LEKLMTGLHWTATQHAAFESLAEFIPRAGRQYASNRNFDLGPTDRSNVSALSPWIRHRTLTEEYVTSTVLQRYSLHQAEKFVQEVVWRTYWKGWLEYRPAVWRSYLANLEDLRGELAAGSAFLQQYDDAVEGRTGIDCFDSWVAELKQYGWLHNHVRMWFASIWIFTLNLPWQLGASFFYEHLLDGDPASNTLSWRWIAGLQTLGKVYFAKADNIARYTKGRFDPYGQLVSEALPLPSNGHPVLEPLRAFGRLTASDDLFDQPDVLMGKIGFLTHDEDLSPFDHPDCAVASAHAILTSLPKQWAFPLKQAFLNGLVKDVAERLNQTVAQDVTRVSSLDEILNWAQDQSLDWLVTPFAPIGETADQLEKICETLSGHGIKVLISQRQWDYTFYPHAKKGFFQMKSKIPQVLEVLNLTRA